MDDNFRCPHFRLDRANSRNELIQIGHIANVSFCTIDFGGKLIEPFTISRQHGNAITVARKAARAFGPGSGTHTSNQTDRFRHGIALLPLMLFTSEHSVDNSRRLRGYGYKPDQSALRPMTQLECT
jgi:hypothetical protein